MTRRAKIVALNTVLGLLCVVGVAVAMNSYRHYAEVKRIEKLQQNMEEEERIGYLASKRREKTISPIEEEELRIRSERVARRKIDEAK